METLLLLDPTNVVSIMACKLMICEILRHITEEMNRERNLACVSFDTIIEQLHVNHMITYHSRNYVNRFTRERIQQFWGAVDVNKCKST